MNILHHLLDDLIDVTIYDLDRLEIWLAGRRRGHPFRPVAGRFAGLYSVDAQGNFIVAQPTLIVGTAYTGALTFVDAAGAAGPGPIGEISSSDPSVSAALSADGQSYNLTATAELTTAATLTWHDLAGAVPDFTTTVATAAEVFVPVSGSFGDLSEGTTV